MKNLKIEVVAVKERCGAKHKPGDVFYLRGEGMLEIPDGKRVCIYALNSLFPFLAMKQHEDVLASKDWVKGTEILACPDPKGVSFKITLL